jgi:hypothetical protein
VLAAREYCGDASLVGEVVDSNTSLPIAGATVTALAQGDPANDRQVQTGPDGHYEAPVQSGETYDLTATAYGYYEQAINDVNVSSPGAEVVNNFSLTPKAAVTLTGTVADGSGQGYPLYARLTFTADGHQEVTFTDPFDGSYSLQLFEDIDYEIEVSAVLNGYRTVSESGVAFTAPAAVRDYALLVGDYCEAPGYLIASGPGDCAVEPGGGVAGFLTDFDSGRAINQEIVQSPDRSTLSQATPDDPALADGYYWLFQALTSSPQTVAITAGSGIRIPQTVDVAMTLGAIVRQDFALKSHKNFFPLFIK